MSNMKTDIFAPLTGRIMSLEEVPDPVFSEKILGDGIAIIPTDGKIYSPIDGSVTTIAETLHAYGFTTKTGVEILVHVGLETVSLNGECFKVYIKEGQEVSVGELIAEVDIDFLQERDIPAITPVLICGETENKSMNKSSGDVVAGKTIVMTLSDRCEEQETGLLGFLKKMINK